MRYRILFFFFSLVFIFQHGRAQHIDIDKKALAFLASEEKVNILFTYDGLLIDDAIPEADFLSKMNKKITKFANEEEAINWAAAYTAHKNDIWPATFTSVLNEKLATYKNPPIFEENSREATYTMKVHSNWMYYGYDAGIVDQPAKVTTVLTFYTSENPETIIFSTEISRAMGQYNKEDGDGEGKGPSLNRMRKAYTKSAYKLAQALKRVVD
ncbi:MAG: hypothetical protein K8F54_06375 [Altibacter sp.]|uniref:hypothetical protein n=1 Tax=Altibacter sp. TaxID=2024823 RepID=UPI001D6CA131|nr:hypothetical protein [Altibacter sp.]MBZ0327214.1 hypothetical protein [Altibacter sp.]